MTTTEVYYEGKTYEIERNANGEIQNIVHVEYSKAVLYGLIIVFLLTLGIGFYDYVKDWTDWFSGVKKVASGDAQGFAGIFGFTKGNLKRTVALVACTLILWLGMKLRDKTATRTPLTSQRVNELKNSPDFTKEIKTKTK